MRKTKSVKVLQTLIVFLIAFLLADLIGWADEAYPSFKGAKKARIIIKEDYGEAKKVSLASDIIKLSSELLRHAGVKVVTEPAETDFTINVDVEGEALRVGIGGGYCYSGAKVKVVVLFNTKDGYKIEEKGEGGKRPSLFVSPRTYLSPDDAPFWEALKGPVIESIGKLLYKSFGITAPLISALKDENSDARKAAALALGKIKDSRAVEPLISSLKDEDILVRKAAAKALWKINPRWAETDEARKVAPEFISSLKDENLTVRRAAAYVLGKIKDSRAVEPLISTLKDKEWVVREAAARAVGEMKDPRAVEPLISLLKDEYWYVRSAAANALWKITGQKFGKDQERWQRWWQGNKAKYSK